MIRFEMIFVILAGIFLGTLILNENSTNMSTSETLVASQLGINAVSIANSYVERATLPSLAFDEAMLTTAAQPNPIDSVAKIAILTTVLGRETGEVSQSQYDDVDDFNGLDTMVTVTSVGNFHVLCAVHYYDPVAANTTFSRTWYKQVDITVTDTVPGLPSVHYMVLGNDQQIAVRKSFVVSYYKFL